MRVDALATCDAGYPSSLGLTFPCGNADLNETGCETSIKYNLYNSSIAQVTLDYDKMTEKRTGIGG